MKDSTFFMNIIYFGAHSNNILKAYPVCLSGMIPVFRAHAGTDGNSQSQ